MARNSAALALDVMQMNGGNGLPSLTITAFDPVDWVRQQAALRDPDTVTPEQQAARATAQDKDVQSKIDELRRQAMDLLNGKSIRDKVDDVVEGAKLFTVFVLIGIVLLVFGVYVVTKD